MGHITISIKGFVALIHAISIMFDCGSESLCCIVNLIYFYKCQILHSIMVLLYYNVHHGLYHFMIFLEAYISLSSSRKTWCIVILILYNLCGIVIFLTLNFYYFMIFLKAYISLWCSWKVWCIVILILVKSCEFLIIF